MNKLFLAALFSMMTVASVQAQEADLFPELKGKFKPAVQPTSAQSGNTAGTTAQATTAEKSETKAPAAKLNVPKSQGQDGTPASKVKFDMQQQTPDEVELGQGKISLSMENVRATLAYARNYSYCFSDVVVRNDTNQKLDELTVVLTYGKTRSRLTFSGIEKKSKKSQGFTMIGEDCALIKGTPQYEILSCKLGQIDSKSCQGRFQFIPPQ